MEGNMTSLDVFIKERIEEIRSRLTVLKSTLLDLDQSFFQIFDRFHSSSVAPPFLYPVSTFRRLNEISDGLSNEVENTSLDFSETIIADRLNLWNFKTNQLLIEVNRLQNVLSQRIASVGRAKILERQSMCEVEYGSLSKAYTAVDVFTLELVRRTLGSDWIKQKKYVPISLFDDRGYMINFNSYVISIPYYDSFRSRFWPILAHEVAHIMVNVESRANSGLGQLMGEGQDILISDLGIFASRAPIQIIELTCDIISAYVCPTAFLVGLECNSMTIPLDSPYQELACSYRFNFSHPPSDSRLIAMESVLELQGILNDDSDLKHITESAKVFFARKNLSLSQPSIDFVEDYNYFSEAYSELVVDYLQSVGVQGFDSDDWATASQLISNPEEEPPSPIHVLVLVWQKRLRKTKTENGLDFRRYLINRKRETKTFEVVMEQIYKYYESRIVPRLRVSPYDIRIDLD